MLMVDKKRTILFIMPRLPFPAVSGRKTSLYHYCRILSDELGYRLVVAAFLEKGDEQKQVPGFIDKLIVLPQPGIKTKVMNILKDSIIKREKPLQVSLYWNPEAKKIVERLVKEEKPQIVIADMVRCTEYIKDLSAFCIADLDDRISLRYQRQLQADIDGINPYGAFINAIPKILKKFLLLKPIKLFVIKNEIDLLKNYELKIGKICDKIIFVAQKEAEEFNRELGEQKAKAVPIGVDIDYFSYCRQSSRYNYIGFLGAMDVAHNESAIRHFVADILPYILIKVPDLKLLVIGSGGSDELKKLESDHVVFTGKVKDVREYLKQCKVFICPLSFGSGIKTKNLEAMSMGIPVVTTYIGAENIGAKNGQDWIIAENDEDYALQICNLLEKPELREKIRKNGRKFVETYWTWNAAREAFLQILKWE